MGYVLLVFIYAAMIAGCFAFALWELRRPADPGPLPIDQSRDIDARHFASLIRRGHGRELRGAQALAGDHPAAYVIRGNGRLEPGTHIDAFICDGVAVIGAGAVVTKHAEGAAALVLGPGARVEGRATSAAAIRLAPGSSLSFASAPVIATNGPLSEPPAPPSTDQAVHDQVLSLIERGTPLDWAVREVSWDTPPNAVGILLTLGDRVASSALALIHSWEPSTKAWYIGAATVRVRGDLTIPEGALVPFNLIVEGTLRAGAGVQFHGGIHTWEDVFLASGCVVWGSITSRRDVVVGPGSHVAECISAGADVIMGDASSVGGERSGGLTAAAHVHLGAGVLVRGKLHAANGALALAR